MLYGISVESDLHPLLSDFAEYYRCTILPTRAGKHKDHVEHAVKNIYTRVCAPLPRTVFHTREDLNRVIGEKHFL